MQKQFNLNLYTMPRKKWNSRDYTKASNTLKRLGYNITYKGNDKSTFRQRGIIRRLYENKKAFINHADFNEKSKDRTIRGQDFDFAFVRLGDKKMKFAKKQQLFSKAQYTPKGVFIEKPANVPRKNMVFRFLKDEVKIDFKGLPVSEDTTLLRRSVVKLDSELLAINPDLAVSQAVGRRKFDTLFLLVNGFRAGSGRAYGDSESFNEYLANTLLPEWYKKNSKTYPEESPEESFDKFANIFHLELIK